MNNVVRNDMAKLLQRSLNAIWESRIIYHIEHSDEIDISYLNSLVEAYIRVENAFKDIIFEHRLKVEGSNFLKKSKFNSLPRRMRVELLDDGDQATRMGYITKSMKEFYQGKCSGISFYLVYNMFSRKIPLDFNKDWATPGYATGEYRRMNLLVERFYVKDGESFVLFKNNWDVQITEKSFFAMNLKGLENLFEEVK